MSRELLTNLTLATMERDGRPYGLVAAGAVAHDGGRIAWCGPADAMPSDYAAWPRRDLGGRLVTPALVDCHTHLVYGGDRAREFEMRLEGRSYEEIARAGGGIFSTVEATRRTDPEALLAGALPRVDALIAEGVSAIEIKSGYGLDIETELAMLRTRAPHRRRASGPGAHELPRRPRGAPGVRGTFRRLSRRGMPAGAEAAHAQGLADAVDGFCEGIAFTPAQIDRVFDRARALGLPVKLHAEQLSDLAGPVLPPGMARSPPITWNTPASPGCAPLPRRGRSRCSCRGRSTPCTPRGTRRWNSSASTGCRWRSRRTAIRGSSPLASLLLAMNMACTLFRLTPEEALAGATREAARALGLSDTGRIAPGLRADLAIWDVPPPGGARYRIGFNPLAERTFSQAQ